MNEMLRRSAIILLASALLFFLASPFMPVAASGKGDIVQSTGERGEESGIGEEAEDESPGLEATSAETPYAGEAAAAEAGEDGEAEQAPSSDLKAAALSIENGPDPWEVTSLDVWKDVDLVEAVDPEIGLEKTASEDYLEMTVGEKKEITFTIEVTAGLSPDTYHITGNIFVQNKGDWPADVTAVSDTVEYKAGGPSWIAAPSSITTTVPLGDNAIPTGGPHVYSYEGTFTLPVALSSVSSMSNLIEITISNKPDPPKPGMQTWTFHSRQDFDKPAAGGPQVVTLEDIESVDPPTGLGYEIKSVTVNGAPAASLTGPWSLDLATAPYTLLITKELTAEAAGTYTLNNKARIGELEDEVEVDIEVKQEEVLPASIAGTKWLDANGNGTADEGESGLDEVTIQLLDADGLPVASTKSAAGGAYSFGGLKPGRYTVQEIVPFGYEATAPTAVTFDLLPGQKKKVDFFNRVPVGGEVVTPPVEPQVQVGAEQTLPATGFDVVYLFIMMGSLFAAGALLASLGAARMIRAR
ncbi:MAG: hypothetical protein H5T73_00245 [Actinobacteria bacterium]|nr:hypothetical protein [Actinomycetota bacterium]